MNAATTSQPAETAATSGSAMAATSGSAMAATSGSAMWATSGSAMWATSGSAMVATSGSAMAASTTDISMPASQAMAAAAESKPKRKNGLRGHRATHRLKRELIFMRATRLPNCSVKIAGDSISEWSATISGPEGSPYEGGIFHFKLVFPMNYPYSPPKVTFKTKIYHCNISPEGDICLDILNEQYRSLMPIWAVMLSITSLLHECNPADPLVGEIAQMYRKHRSEHDRIAAQWTEKYARE